MRKQIKIPALILTVVLASVMITSCGSKTIEIPMFDGTVIEVETKGLTKDQVNLLEQVSSGELRIMGLMQSGLFTPDELTEIGFANTGMNPVKRDGMVASGTVIQDFSGVDINTLNLDGLSNEQIDVIEDIIAGETTVQAVVESGIFTQQQIMSTGLMSGEIGSQRPAGGNSGPNSGGNGSSNSGGNTQGGGDNSN